MIAFASLLAGLVFGLGLIVSGMANPAKVLGFLDLAGTWDPSLAFVMAGAIAVGGVAFAVANRRALSFLGTEMRLPSARHIDRRLVLGSVLFGSATADQLEQNVTAYATFASLDDGQIAAIRQLAM